ncbi:mechanosensitive ion channel family protein [Jannaschia sp. W003]|uniref:mechanosensitive ion channel family protein n=1 Tax=Jannaschia sp. W003 TaxID=2867012 RepID=UPI0021A7A7DD|nr:mechanosensitive ion channel family protein [Jannaschia sp. W003]UWQ20961.1 mechanosensitive ion channel [Jannaschia sp. W003]
MMRFLLVLLLLALPAFAQEAEAPPSQPSGAISVEEAGGGDAAIARRIRGILGELDGFEGVTVEAAEGIVTFRGEVLSPEAVDRLGEIAARVEGVVAVENEVTENTEVARRLDPVVDRFRARAAQVVAYLPLVAVAAAVGLAVAGAGWALAAWDRPWARLAPNGFIAQIYRALLRLVFAGVGIVVALDILDATWVLTGLLGAAGIVGLAVGFAVQDTVENFIASVMLSLRQPFRPNDIVEIEGSLGTVIRLTSRATILLDPDGNHLRLPNSTVFKARILNYTRNAERRFGFMVGVDPEADIAEAREIGLRVLRGLPFVLEAPPPRVWIKDVGASTVDMEFFAWLDQTRAEFPVARSEAIRLVLAALGEADIGVPEPTYRINVAGGGLPVIDLPDRRGRPEGLTATEGEEAAPAAPVAAAPAPVAPDRTLDTMVREERAAKGERDLLSTAAPEE